MKINFTKYADVCILTKKKQYVVCSEAGRISESVAIPVVHIKPGWIIARKQTKEQAITFGEYIVMFKYFLVIYCLLLLSNK